MRREDRIKIQGEQTKAWLEQQIAEKKQEEYEKREAERLYQEALVARDKRAMELAKMEEECLRKINESTALFNKSLVSSKRIQEVLKIAVVNDVTVDRLKMSRHVLLNSLHFPIFSRLTNET